MGWTGWSRQFKPEPVAPNAEAPATGVLSFVEFVNIVNPAFQWHRHNLELAKVCQRVADDELKRLIVCQPPGTSKSEMFSRLLPAYYSYRHPARTVGLVSYGASLAADLAGDAREYYIAAGGKLHQSTAAKDDWRTLRKGGMWGKGFAGPVRGRRFHLGIVDDPHKGAEDLESETLCNKFSKWWNRTWLNRQNLFFKGGAAIVVVMQRLAENDLVGWLLSQPDADQWTIVCLDAIRSEESWQQVDEKGRDIGAIPMGCTVLPDWRKPGELLSPDLLSHARLKEQQADEGTYLAQFLQRPPRLSGVILDADLFKRCQPHEVPFLISRVLGVDLAVKEKETADFTVAFPLGYGMNGMYYLFNPYRAQASAPKSEVAVSAKAKAFFASIVGVEETAFQTSFIQHLQADITLAGIPVIGIPADMDKVTRARGWRPLLEQGLIWLVDDGTGWIEVFLAEVKKFPRGKKDQVDGVGMAIATLRYVGVAHAPLTGGQREGIQAA